jgi:putative membrane protein
MVDDHTKANSELKKAAADAGITLPTAADSEQKALADKLSKLSGPEFDKAYMKDMVKDHEKDVAAFEKAAKSEGEPAVKTFAEKTLPTLQDHLKMAKDVDQAVTHGS